MLSLYQSILNLHFFLTFHSNRLISLFLSFPRLTQSYSVNRDAAPTMTTGVTPSPSPPHSVTPPPCSTVSNDRGIHRRKRHSLTETSSSTDTRSRRSFTFAPDR